MLTRKQQELLLFIHERMKESGIPPSFDEMKEALDLKSKSGIHRLVTALEERGFIRRLPHRARALEIVRLPETLSKAATVTATGVAVSLARFPGTAVEQISLTRQHWQALGTAPSAAVGAGSGGGSASISGVDVAGQFTITTGAAPAGGALCSWTPVAAYNSIGRVQITARNAATAALFASGVWVSGTTSAQTVNTVAAPAATTVYEFDYLVIEG